MTIRFLKLFALFAALICLAGARQVRAQSGTFTYQNPMPRGVVDGLRDPYILNVDGIWYMTGTAKPFFEFQYPTLGVNPGVPLYSSPDLKTWTYRGVIVPRVSGSWYQDRFWAPEIHVKTVGGARKFYCTFNCFNVNQNNPQGVGLAVATNITGPYTVLTPNAPLTQGNDGSIFTDTDGNDYLLVAGMYAMPLDLVNARVTGAAWTIVGTSPTPGWDGGNGVGVEDPDIIKIGGTYYCFYSSWGRGYEVGYATATNIRGPWTKYAVNPIYGAQNQAACNASGATYTQAANVPYKEVGGGAPFVGPDGRWWLSAHFALNNPDPATTQYHGWCQPGYDPLTLQNGNFLAQTPTWTPQTVSLTGAIADGNYKIVAATTGNVLDCEGFGTTNGTRIHIWPFNNTNNQKWNLHNNGHGTYSIRTINPDNTVGRSLDCTNCSPNDGTKIELWDIGGGTCQSWTITSTGGSNYKISTAGTKADGTHDVLDGENCSGAQGANVLLWSWGGGGCQQQWQFVPV